MSEPEEQNDKGPSEEESIPTASMGGSGAGSVGQIGPYKLLSVLGEGGFGVVYLAERQRPVKRRVALKVIKPGMDTKQVIARFEAERQALALLEHPNIAHVFNAGTTDAGRPYFVMEYVKGVPITEHCDRHKLTIEERLNLFLQACEAVQYAHQKGIIHRDVKPSNIQVCIQGKQVIPKVIDFGVAKAISQPLTERTLVTEQGQFVGTPEYMSPEQAEMTGQDVDTRSDIYSLGVVLYELLTGVLPFDPATLREGGVDHIRQVIREEDPKTPSTRLSTLYGEESTRLAQRRRVDPGALQRRLRGDLDWITLKAMEKDRTRRYQTAHALAEDIQRHLAYEPVLAGPPSKIYRLKKLLRKYRTQAIAAATAAVLLAFIAVILVMYVQAAIRGKEVDFLKDKEILSRAMELRSSGQFQDALSKVETIVDSEHVGPKARLLRSRLVLELEGPAAAVKELQKLLNERDEIACHAYFLLARIYIESAPGDPEKTEEYQQKAKEHQQKGEKLFYESAEAFFNRSMMAGTVTKTLEWLNKAIDLDEDHYDSLEARALAYYALRRYGEMEIDASVMIGNESNNSQGYALRAIARREKAKEEGKKELLSKAIKDHNKAIRLSPDDPELYDQRRRTHLQMGNYEKALSDARECVRLKPDDKMYHFHVFCALVASGHSEEARTEYEAIIKSGLMEKWELHQLAAKYVSDTLDAGLQWHPSERRPGGAAFGGMHESAEVYNQLAQKGRRVVPEGFHPTWSPDGTELAYSCGILGFSGIEIINPESGKTRLLTVPGLDPAWSPDGEYIAFVRIRQPMLLTDFTTEREAKQVPHEQREVWVIKADGTEEPRFLAKGSFPCWSRDSRKIYYHWQKEMKLLSISLKEGGKPTPVVWCPGYFPVVSPDEQYVAYGEMAVSGERRIVELSTKSIIARWPAPPVSSSPFLNWSPNGEELSVGSYGNSGLWIYDVKTQKASRVLSGSFAWCSFSGPDTRKIAIERVYGGLHREIWVADLAPDVSIMESLGPGRTLEEHCQEMVDIYTRRIEAEPNDVDNYFLRASFHICLEDKEKAFADVDKIADIMNNPSMKAQAYANLAYRLVDTPQQVVDPGIAVELFRKAHEIQPKNWGFLTGLGEAHYRAGQWEEATAAFNKSNELPGSERSLNFLFLSMAHWQSGDKATAANSYKKAVELLQKSNIDIASSQGIFLQVFYMEAAELMGIKEKEFYRKAPLTGEQIMTVTARADSSHLDMMVEHIVDGSGLADGDEDSLLEHEETPENMWLSEQGRTGGLVEFDLGGVYELGSILVWNYNERNRTRRGIRKADISVWIQNSGWQKIFDDFEFTEAEGSFDYDEPILVRFDGVKAQRVRFDDLTNLGDDEYIGLSEVQFFEMRGPEAIRPRPADGQDIGVPLGVKLSWTPGAGVKTYEVYFGADADSLKCIGRIEAGDISEVNLPGFEKRRRYWWRVDAEKLDGSVKKGELWSFSTGRIVGWWKFDRIEGRIAADSSGSGQDGKLVEGACIISEPERSNVLSLDGEGDYVSCGRDLRFDITGEITISAWVKVNKFDKRWQTIIAKGDTAWRLQRNRDTDNFAFSCTGLDVPGDQYSTVRGKKGVNDGKWHHTVGVYDGKRICLYIDGELDVSANATGSINTNSWEVLIGENAERPGRFWNGLIDDVRVYSYALSEAGIKALYAGKGPGPTED